MVQAKFSLHETHVEFLKGFKKLGFKDKSELVRVALDRLRREIEREKLRESAELYAEVYAKDDELQKLADSATEDWPE